MRNYLLGLLLISWPPAPLHAVTSWSAGTTISQGQGGVSIQTKPNYRSAVHGSYLFLGGSRPQITVDYQKFTNRLFNTAWRAYAGGGIGAQLKSDDKRDEVYHLRTPIGLQYDSIPYNIQLFTEAVGMFGPLPATDSKAALSLGLRAWF